MTVTNQDALDIAALSAARNPRWTDASGTSTTVTGTGAGSLVDDEEGSPPFSSSSGSPLYGELFAMVAVDLHTLPGRPRILLAPSEVTNSSAYTFVVDAHEVTITSDGSATRAEILDALVTEFESVEPPGLRAEVIEVDGEDVIALVSTDGAAHVVTGQVRLTVTRESSRVAFRVWGLASGQTQWHVLRPVADSGLDVGSDGVIVTRSNAVAIVRVSGLSRVAVQVVQADGTWSTRVGRCEAEA